MFVSAENVQEKIPLASSKEGYVPSEKDLIQGRRDSTGVKNGILAPNSQTPHLNGVKGKYLVSEKISTYTNLLKDGRYVARISGLEKRTQQHGHEILSWQKRKRRLVWNDVLIIVWYRFIRLRDAIEVLEDMEQRGYLDMNKVINVILILQKGFDFIFLFYGFLFCINLCFQVYHGRFFNMCKTKKAVREAFRFINLIPSPTLSTYNMLMSVCTTSQDAEGSSRFLWTFFVTQFSIIFTLIEYDQLLSNAIT